GIEVVSTEISEILPPDEIPAAAARLRIEKAQAEYESVELEAVQKWIDQLALKGIKPELALEVMQTEREKAKVERKIIRFEHAEEVAKIIAAATERLAGAILANKESK
ncbi:MAG TPA: hypothetical protein VEA41_09245, partial [Salinarimonas sp.]|nr:hypothetical protein [Salinarimonas sp.]